MAINGTGTGSSTISTQFQQVFVKKMLDHAVQLLCLDQFGQKVPFPRNAGALTMTFMRPDVADPLMKSNPTGGTSVQIQSSANEGQPLTVFRAQTYTYVTATMAQFMEGIKLTDVLTWTQLYDAMETGTTTMGEDVALYADSTIRNELVGAVTGTGNRRYVGLTQTFAGLSALSTSAGTLTIQDLLDGMTQATIQRAPKLDGEYVCVAGAQVGRDILSDPKVVLAGQYGTSKALLNGEIGRWYGVRVVQCTNPFIEASGGTEGTYSTAGVNIYRTFVLGKGAYGIPILAGGSPFSPRIMICRDPDKADPANNFVTATVKGYWTVKTLNAVWAVSISSKSTFA